MQMCIARVGLFITILVKSRNQFFSENRKEVSPHDELTPMDSAKIIINHVIDGVSLGKKNNFR